MFNHAKFVSTASNPEVSCLEIVLVLVGYMVFVFFSIVLFCLVGFVAVVFICLKTPKFRGFALRATGDFCVT